MAAALAGFAAAASSPLADRGRMRARLVPGVWLEDGEEGAEIPVVKIT